MKLRANLITVSLSVLFMSFLSMTTDSYQDNGSTEWLKSLIMDEDISRTPIENNFIFYSTGHHGQVWSVVSSEGTGLRLFNGNTKFWKDEIKQIAFDTIKFMKRNMATLQWGLDTLPVQAYKMAPQYSSVYSPLNYSLKVIYLRENLIFSSANTTYYSGPDSAEFNDKYGRLCFIMFWLAAPEIRPHIPDSEIF